MPQQNRVVPPHRKNESLESEQQLQRDLQHLAAMVLVLASAWAVLLQWFTPIKRIRLRNRLAEWLLRRGQVKLAMHVRHFNLPKSKP